MGLHSTADSNYSWDTFRARAMHSNNDAGLPEFSPTASKNLDHLLQTFRDKIFLPANLSHDQKKIVYQRKNWALITNPDEPATARLGDEVVQLKPLDRTKDEPNTRRSFLQVLKLMRETGDWRNLFGFLEGLRVAKRTIKGDQVARMMRWLLESGKHPEVLEILERVEENGISVWEPQVAREIMWGAWKKVSRLGWSKTAITNGTRYAEDVWNLMSGPKHSKNSIPDGLNTHPTWRPELLGVLLQLHAAKAVANEKDADARLQTEKYAGLLLTTWNGMELDVEESNWNDWNHKMCIWAPVWHGMKLARNVLGSECSAYDVLDAKEKELELLLQEGRSAVTQHMPEEGSRCGVVAFDEMRKFPTPKA